MESVQEPKPVDLVTVPLISFAVISGCTVLIWSMTFGVRIPVIVELQESIVPSSCGNLQLRNLAALTNFVVVGLLGLAVPTAFVLLLQKRLPDDLIRGNSDAVWYFATKCLIFTVAVFLWSLLLGDLRVPGNELRQSFFAFEYQADPDGQIEYHYSWLLYFGGYVVIGAIFLFVKRLRTLCLCTLAFGLVYWFGISGFIEEANKRSRFDREAWQTANPHLSNKRVSMALTVIKELEEKSKYQVKQLLGTPEKSEKSRWSREHWFYYLGTLYTSSGAQPLYLCIELYGDKVVISRLSRKDEWVEIYGHP